jgi:hypothetical protein
MDIGLGVAGSTGSLIPALARSASAAGAAARERKESLRTREGQVSKGLADIAEGERLIQLGDIAAGNAMYKEGAERINKLDVAMSRPKDTNQKDSANAYVAAQLAKGDKRNKDVIYNEGVNLYLDKVQASGLLRGQIAGQVANTQNQEFNASLYTAAATQVERILKSFRSNESEIYNKLAREDRANGTNNSGAYRDKLINNTLEALKRSGGISANTGTSTNTNANTGTGGKPPPPENFVVDKKKG